MGTREGCPYFLLRESTMGTREGCPYSWHCEGSTMGTREGCLYLSCPPHPPP